MFFNESEKYNNPKLYKSLLWEFDVNNTFNWKSMRHLVVQRVIEMGSK